MIEAPKKKETKQNTEDKTHKNSEIFKKLSKTHFITPLYTNKKSLSERKGIFYAEIFYFKRDS